MSCEAEVVLVTEVEYAKAKAVFEGARADGLDCRPVDIDEATLAAAVRSERCRAVIVGVERYEDALYEALPAGGVIARFGVGHDGVDKARATKAGIAVTNTPGVLEVTVAEHAMWLMGALARRVAQLDAATRCGLWAPGIGTELAGKRLTILGCGGIGRRVARMASAGFGMVVTGFGRRPDAGAELAKWGIQRYVTDLGEALADAEVLSVHLSATNETRGFLNRETLAMLPRGALFVNTARGSIVDEGALYDALTEEQLGGAALDVFANEPYAPADPQRDLRTLANVVMTPHVGSATHEACARMASRALANVRAWIDGQFDEVDLINTDVARPETTS